MKVVRFASGLGNVMLQYALYLQVRNRYPNEKVYIDTIFYKYTGYPFELLYVFKNIKLDDFYDYYLKLDGTFPKKIQDLRFWEDYNMGYAEFTHKYPTIAAGLNLKELPEIYKERYADMKIVSNLPLSISNARDLIDNGERITFKRRVRLFLENKLLKNHSVMMKYVLALHSPVGRRRLVKQLLSLQKPDLCCMDELSRIESEGDVYFNLYGSYCDCDGLRDKLVRMFEFPELDKKNDERKRIIESNNTVAIHARVGHFEYGMGDILKRNYYKKAVKYIRKKSGEELQFCIFSDDIDWCKKNKRELGLKDEDSILWIDGNVGKDSYKDMQLMTYCKYHIIPNSTFSWWGGFLSQRDNKIMITPYGTMPGTISF